MPKIEEHTQIEDDMVMGTVSTNKVGSETSFPICSVKEWILLDEFEADTLLVEAMWGSGYIDLYY